MIEVCSETVATVWLIKVEAGQTVKPGDVIAVLESMKIEIPVEAPVAGVVVEVRVAEKTVVEDGDVIAVIAP